MPAESTMITDFVLASSYHWFVSAKRRLCNGYMMASDDQGGRVDCVANCKTGRGYCYATEAGFCRPCVLWYPLREEGDVPLCAEHVRAHGILTGS